MAEPHWVDTIIPAIALGLPAGFYLARVLYLKLREELGAQYVDTAASKGLSERRIFYRHIMSNAWPTLTRQIPVVSGIVISSALFAEFFLEYQGQLFYFTYYGIGWNMITGLGNSVEKPSGIPSYEPGVILVIGLMLVVVWLFSRLVTDGWHEARFPHGIRSTPAANILQIGWGWIVCGTILVGAIIVFGADPKLLTAASPTHWHLANYATGKTAPFAPSSQYPFGTDAFGRDSLSRTLHGTFPTLVPAVIVTVLVLAGALAVSIFGISNPAGWLSRTTNMVGRVLSAIPALFILFLILFNRSLHSPDQELEYIVWIAVVELGRGSYAFLQSMAEWYQFGFIEGVESIGRRRITILFTHLGSWLRSFGLEFAFSEFTRVLSLMMMLAVFHIYTVSKIGGIPFYRTPGVESAQMTWFAMIGNSTNDFSFIGFPFLLYAPVLALLITMIGANLIARGLRGTAKG